MLRHKALIILIGVFSFSFTIIVVDSIVQHSVKNKDIMPRYKVSAMSIKKTKDLIEPTYTEDAINIYNPIQNPTSAEAKASTSIYDYIEKFIVKKDTVSTDTPNKTTQSTVSVDTPSAQQNVASTQQSAPVQQVQQQEQPHNNVVTHTDNAPTTPSKPTYVVSEQAVVASGDIQKSQATVVSSSDANLLARFVYAEAGSEDYGTKLAIANSVLARSNAENIPLSALLVSSNYPSVNKRQFSDTPSETCVTASSEAISGRNQTPSVYYFTNTVKGSSPYDSSKIVAKLGNFTFYAK